MNIVTTELLPLSWDNWVALSEEAGFVGLTSGQPDDPEPRP